MSDTWTDEEFLGYVEIHSQSERALFIAEHVNRLLELAGHKGRVEEGSWRAVYWDEGGQELVRLARERLKKAHDADALLDALPRAVAALNELAKRQQDPPPRMVVCAANRWPDGTIILGVRHWDIYMHCAVDGDLGLIDLPAPEEGFIDQCGVFMDRREAWQVAEAAGQIRRRVGGDDKDGGTLYSENLY